MRRGKNAGAAILVAAVVLSVPWMGCNSILGWEDSYVLGTDGGTDGTLVGDHATALDVGGDHLVAPPPEGGGDTGVDGGAPDAGDANVPCSPSSCAGGCCGTDQACHPMSPSTCGKSGMSCQMCAANETCDSTGTCVPKCTPTSCASGCCDATGACQPGTSNGSCGTNGASCGSCTGTNVCNAGKCGCGQSSDCPSGQACDTTAHTCGNACVGAGGSVLTCNGGCCDVSGSMLCVPGSPGGRLCAGAAAACTDCSTSPTGHVCKAGGTCGCSATGDCPANEACGATGCSNSCAGGLACNGGCCDGTTCQKGTAAGTCGGTGGSCVSCTNASTGHVCEPNDTCGCGMASDCSPGQACTSGSCSPTCAAGATCNGGCCAGGLCVLLATCQSAHATCGNIPDGCGGSIPCGTCPPGNACQNNTCVPVLQTVFVIVMENENWSSIKGNASAPYINSLLPMGAHAENYFDNPNAVHPSEPNYIWMEAGDNLGITSDSDPVINHQGTTQHLVTLLAAAGVSWRAYVESIPGGSCPIASSGLFAPKHTPMLFFDDVVGNPPSTSASTCIQHVVPFGNLASDLAAGTVARYNFITPNLCDDMHNTTGCPNANPIANGDTWLQANLPSILSSTAYSNNGVVFIVWDESEGGEFPIGLIALSPKAKVGYSNSVRYYHSSLLRTAEEIFGVTPLLRDAANQSDLGDLFTSFP